MRIDKFLSSLVPFFKKDQLREDLSNIREELIQNTLPPYTTAISTFAKHKWNSKYTQAFQVKFDRNVRTEFRGNYIMVTYQVLKRLEENLPAIDKLVEMNYNEDVMREGMTFLRSNLLQYVESIKFALKYSRAILNYTLWFESDADDRDSGILGVGPSKTDLEYIDKEMNSFFVALNALSAKRAHLEKAFKDIPDVIATGENVSQVEQTVGVNRTDPFKFNLIPKSFDPIYHIRLRIAEYQVEKYKTAVEEKKLLELRLTNMRLKAEGNLDPKVQALIASVEDRIQKLNYRIAEMEEEYA